MVRKPLCKISWLWIFPVYLCILLCRTCNTNLTILHAEQACMGYGCATEIALAGKGICTEKVCDHKRR